MAELKVNQNEKEVLEKYDRESVVRENLVKPIAFAIMIFAVGLSLFHLYTSFAGPLMDIKQRSLHLYVLMAIAFILYPISLKAARNKVPWYDIIIALSALGITWYMFNVAERIIQSGGRINDTDFYVGAVAILLVLDATRRVTGWGLPILATSFLVYGFYTRLSIYEELNEKIIMSVSKLIVGRLVYVTEGILGTAIGVSASYIVLFILFGAFLSRSGMGHLFNDLAMALAGHTRGGPAKVSVIASGFLGSINGAAVANVVTTGAFTIPLMKKIGYHKNFAGAVESAASVGGQILPPIMGAAAFIMAENLGIAYTQIIMAAIIPAILFYLGVILQVHFRAVKNNLSGIARENLPAVLEVLKERGHLLIPLVFLVFLLFSGKTPLFAAFWSIVATIIISGSRNTLFLSVFISMFVVYQKQIMALLQGAETIPNVRKDWWLLLIIIFLPLVVNLIRKFLKITGEEMTISDCKHALESGAKTTISVAVACACVGIVVGIATLTGAALEIANVIVGLGTSVSSPLLQLVITLFFTMVASIVLGMGLPSIPTYIITSTMAAPILLATPLFRELAGSPDNAIFIAHMFVFYFGIFANITPPVALASFAAAGISGGDPNRTGFQSMRLAIAGFIVPFMFVFAPHMLMIDATIWNILFILATSVTGVFMLSVAVEGYFVKKIPLLLRLLTGFSAILLIFPGVFTDSVGFITLIILLVYNYKK
jgi:TRAP transporter 4TM/12TM fusion protein